MNKDVTFTLRLSITQREQWKQDAKKAGLSMAQYALNKMKLGKV